jgi:hypothetical protein
MISTKQTSLIAIDEFQPSQIVCLEHQNIYLYSEVVQVISDRQLCWVRPLVLAIIRDSLTTEKILDLRFTSDLLWPINLFRPALDTEVIPLLSELDSPDYRAESIQNARQQLNYYIQQFWQGANQDR